MRTALRVLNYVMGAAFLVIGIVVFGITGTIVDSISIAAFLKGCCTGTVIFAVGFLMVRLAEIDK